MKVTIKYEHGDDEDDEVDTAIKLTLPKAWLSGPVEKVKKTFIDQFNKKHPEEKLDQCFIESSTGQVIPGETIVEQVLTEECVIFVRRDKTMKKIIQSPPPAVVATTSTSSSSANNYITTTPTNPTTSTNTNESSSSDNNTTTTYICKRFGCGKRYSPDKPEPCIHHSKPPVFHETRKYWACCPDKIAWDWDSFTAIPGCQTDEQHSGAASGGAKVMGGTEVRAERSGDQGPQLINKPPPSGLDKLSSLRSALISLGVSGTDFDRVRDNIKRLHEDGEGKNVWEKVATEMANKIQKAFSEQ
jgi:hypothetical protein